MRPNETRELAAGFAKLYKNLRSAAEAGERHNAPISQTPEPPPDKVPTTGTPATASGHVIE